MESDLYITKSTKQNGGTNTPILIGLYNQKKCVIKQYNFDPNSQSNTPKILLKDYLKARDHLIEANLLIPKLLTYFYTNKDLAIPEFNISQKAFTKTHNTLVLVEEYCGTSLRELIRKKNISSLEKQINLVREYITKMPLDVELDTNPANFTFFKNKIYFVDFMPPKIEKYQSNKVLCDLFPQIRVREIEREKRRKNRYRTLTGRLERFTYYLSLISPNTQQT